MKQFIRKHRDELTEIIRRQVPNIGSINDEEREQWVMNDESLYNWAQSEGVPV